MEEILKNIYKFGIPLANTALKEINIYVIKDGDKAFVFDTGYNTEECKNVMLENLNKLEIEIKNCSLILTHLHADHTGLASYFYENGAKIYSGKIDGDLMNGMAIGGYWDTMMSLLPLYDMENEVGLEDNPGYKYKIKSPIKFETLNIGDVIKAGDYNLQIVDLEGHTPGHIGLLEKEKNFLFGADTVLDPITPNITFWGYEWKDILATYMSTLKRLRDLNLDFILPTHRAIIKNPNHRIDELIYHHFLRLQEILDSMEENRDDYTIREISKNISWRVRAKNWDEFPKSQKWFATGETMAHVEYLVIRGFIEERKENGVLNFKKIKKDINSSMES